MKRFLGLMLAFSFVFSLAVFAEPQHGGSLTIAMEYDPSTLDPLGMTDTPAANVFMHVAEALFRVDPDGVLEYLLAESYEVSDDSLVWTFFLRQGVEFHDGTPFNAEAAKWNLIRFRDEASFGFLLAQIVDIDIVDEYTIRVHLDEPFAPLLSHLAHSFTGLLSPTAVEAGVDYPVGTGPFKYVEWTPATRLVLERNPNYWGEGPYLDRLVFLPIPEGGTRVMMLLAGEIEATTLIPVDDVALVEENPDTVAVIMPSLGHQYIGINCQRGPLADPLVRQALNYALDKEEFVDFVFGGFAEIADSVIAPGVFGYTKVGPYPYDPEKARELLTEAGYPDGFSTTIRYNPGWRELGAEVLQAQLAEVGIDARLISMEWGSYLEFTNRPVEQSEVDIYMLGWTTVTSDADYALYALLHGDQWAPGGSNRSFYRNERVDELLDAARRTPVAEEREQLYAEALELIWEDAPWVFILFTQNRFGVRSNVRGLVYHPNFTIQAHKAWLER